MTRTATGGMVLETTNPVGNRQHHLTPVVPPPSYNNSAAAAAAVAGAGAKGSNNDQKREHLKGKLMKTGRNHQLHATISNDDAESISFVSDSFGDSSEAAATVNSAQ